MRNLCLLFLIVSSFNIVLSQKNFITSRLTANRIDYFHEFGYTRSVNNWEVGGGIGYGINRTVFQQRFFPRFNIQGAYAVLKKNKFQLQPTFALGFSVLKINKLSDKFTNWTETLGGFSWFYGDKWAIGQTLQLGYLFENYFNSIQGKREFVSVWSYYIAINVRYEF